MIVFTNRVCGMNPMASLVGQSVMVLPLENGNYKVWEDQSFIKWRKRDSHVTLHCHDSIEGQTGSLCLYLISHVVFVIWVAEV